MSKQVKIYIWILVGAAVTGLIAYFVYASNNDGNGNTTTPPTAGTKWPTSSFSPTILAQTGVTLCGNSTTGPDGNNWYQWTDKNGTTWYGSADNLMTAATGKTITNQ